LILLFSYGKDGGAYYVKKLRLIAPNIILSYLLCRVWRS